MKNSLLALFLGSLFLISCNQKEMKISRSDYSVVTELHDISPVYIDKDKSGKAMMNKNNLIGNTHWVISAERDLTLNDIAPFLQELTDKKHKKGGMHEDTKDIYFIYSDTVHKQNAFVKLPFRQVFLDKPADDTESIILDKTMSVETFVNTLIDLEKQGTSNDLGEEVYVY